MSLASLFPIKRLVERYASFAGARIALIIGRWFVLLQSAKSLSKAEFAVLAATLSLVEIIRAISDLGTDSYIYARIGSAAQPLRPTVRAALFLRLAVSAMLTVIAILVLVLLDMASTAPVCMLIIASACQSIGVSLLQKKARFNALGIMVAITLLASIGVDLAALSPVAGLSLMAWLLIAPDCVAGLASLFLARESLISLFTTSSKGRRNIFLVLRPAISRLFQSAIITVLVMMYSRLDVTVVRPIAGVTQQADFSVGFRLVEPIFLFFAIASLALLAELGSGEASRTRVLTDRILKINYMFVLLVLGFSSLLIAVVMQALAVKIFKFDMQVGILVGVIAAALPFRIANSVTSTLLLRFGRFDAVMAAAVLNGMITFSLAFILVNILGALGAAIAMVAGEILNSVYQRIRLKKHFLKNTRTF